MAHASPPRIPRSTPAPLVSFAAVIKVVTRHATLLPTKRCVTSDDPNNDCEGDYRTPGLGVFLWHKKWQRHTSIAFFSAIFVGTSKGS